jgi:hypothetical protein
MRSGAMTAFALRTDLLEPKDQDVLLTVTDKRGQFERVRRRQLVVNVVRRTSNPGISGIGSRIT